MNATPKKKPIRVRIVWPDSQTISDLSEATKLSTDHIGRMAVAEGISAVKRKLKPLAA